MSLIDSILNLAALLLWLSWRGVGASEPVGAPGTLLGNLRPASTETIRRGRYLAALGILLAVRPFLYHQVGPALGWHAVWDTGVVSVAYRSDLLSRMAVFSAVGFAGTLVAWFSWIVFLTVFNAPPHDRDPVTRQVRRHLRRFLWIPGPVRLLLPVAAMAGLWMAVGGHAAATGLIPPFADRWELARQALVVGWGAWVHWRWLLAGLYVLYLLNNYVYLGRHPFWEFVQHTGARLSRPFQWLRFGRVELGPVAGLVLSWVGFSLVGTGFAGLRGVFPGMPDWVESGLLATLFRTLPAG